MDRKSKAGMVKVNQQSVVAEVEIKTWSWWWLFEIPGREFARPSLGRDGQWLSGSTLSMPECFLNN